VTQASEVSGRIVFGAWALLLALAAVPIFSTVLPPLADYPNHLARFYLLAQGGNDYYAVRWAPLPNLAGDVIVPALAQAMPLGLAAKVFLVTTFALLTGGTLWLSRVTSGGWRLWPLMSFLLLYNREFLLGFLNYLFALGVALCGTALWLAVERRPSGERMAISSVMALICFFCHISGFSIYAIAIAGLEAMPAWAECRLHRWRELAWRSVVTGAQFLIPASIADDAHGVGRIVAADIQEPGRAVRLQRCEDVPAIGQIGLVLRRAQGRGRRSGDRFEIGPAFGRKVDEILVHDAAHPVARAIDPLDLRKQSRFEHRTGQRLIDHRCRAAAHGDHQLAASHSLWPPVGAFE